MPVTRARTASAMALVLVALPVSATLCLARCDTASAVVSASAHEAHAHHPPSQKVPADLGEASETGHGAAPADLAEASEKAAYRAVRAIDCFSHDPLLRDDSEGARSRAGRSASLAAGVAPLPPALIETASAVVSPATGPPFITARPPGASPVLRI